MIFIHSRFRKLFMRGTYVNIYTPSVFCYDKHRKNFDIQFSMKRHETVVTTNNDARRIMTGVFCIKNGYFVAKTVQFDKVVKV